MKTKKVRIIRIVDNGAITFQVQQKHLLFRLWIRASLNCWSFNCKDTFGSLIEAESYLKSHFLKSGKTERMVLKTYES